MVQTEESLRYLQDRWPFLKSLGCVAEKQNNRKLLVIIFKQKKVQLATLDTK